MTHYHQYIQWDIDNGCTDLLYLDENNRSNSFNVILKNAESLKQLAGPVYVQDDNMPLLS